MNNTLIKKLLIFFYNIKDSLFCILESDRRIFRISRSPEKIILKAKFWLKRLSALVPELSVNYIGSTSLNILQKDIDFIIDCEPKNFNLYIPKINDLFGLPTKITRKFIEWRYKDKGTVIETIMTTTKSGIGYRYVKKHRLLKLQPQLLDEYRKMKFKYNGKPYKKFELARIKFFNKIYFENQKISFNNNFFEKHINTILTIATVVISLGAFLIAYYSGEKNLSNYDAIARLNIARKIFDSLTPGVAQLGGIWLPFPQLLFMPFIWSDFLWHSGIAGAISSMIAFILSSIFLYKTVYLITGKKTGGVLAWLIYVSNINMLYLQTMAMSESFFLYTLIMVIYYLTKWGKTKNLLDLIYAGFFVMLTTLTRYEGYSIFGAAALTVAIICLVGFGKANYKRFEGMLILFLTLAGFGIFVWSLYSLLIFKDAFYWLNLYTGHKQIIALDPTEVRQAITNNTVVSAKPTLFGSINVYGSAMIFMNGIILSIFGAMGFIYLLIKNSINIFKKKLDILSIPMMVITICIFLFLLVGYHKGFIPNIETPFITWANLFNKANNFGSSSNIRYGIIILPLLALIVGMVYSKSKILTFIIIASLSFQIYTLFRTPLFLTFSIPTKEVYQMANASIWFKENYDSGLVLTSANRHENFIFQTGLPYKDFVYEGSQDIWKDSLKNPADHVRWIVVDIVDDGDAVNFHIPDKKVLDKNFKVVFKEGNLVIYKIK